MQDNIPTTAIGTMRLMATTQTQIDVFSDQVINSVKSGEASALEVLIMLKAFEKMADRVLKEIRENFVNEADKYTERVFEFNGNKIEKAEVGTKYDYSVCNDPVYNSLSSILKNTNTQVKEREEFLKALKQPITILDEGTGEVVTINPPLKTSTTSLKVSIR